MPVRVRIIVLCLGLLVSGVAFTARPVSAQEAEVAQPGSSTDSCDCSTNRYTCSDFPTWSAAQACFNQCRIAVGFDIHALDENQNGIACELAYPEVDDAPSESAPAGAELPPQQEGTAVPEADLPVEQAEDGATEDEATDDSVPGETMPEGTEADTAQESLEPPPSLGEQPVDDPPVEQPPTDAASDAPTDTPTETTPQEEPPIAPPADTNQADPPGGLGWPQALDTGATGLPGLLPLALVGGGVLFLVLVVGGLLGLWISRALTARQVNAGYASGTPDHMQLQNTPEQNAQGHPAPHGNDAQGYAPHSNDAQGYAPHTQDPRSSGRQ